MKRSRFVFLLLIATATPATESRAFGQPGNIDQGRVGAVTAVAEDKPAEEPRALVQARDAYVAKVEAVGAPITADYLKALDNTLKSYCAKGDLASALAVQREIDRHSSKANSETVVGKWTWDGHDKEFLDNGVFVADSFVRGVWTTSFVRGVWTTIDKKARKYRVVWVDEKGQSNGFVDSLQMSADGSTLSGKSNHDHSFTGKRIGTTGPEAAPTGTVSVAKPAKDPDALVKMRNVYLDKVKAAVDPITADYLKDLDKLLRSFGGAGDLASALLVQKEIKSQSNKANPDTIVGKWTWYGREKEFLANGVFICWGRVAGKWAVVDKDARKYQVLWINEKGRYAGPIETFVISEDGATLAGRGSKGNTYTATRIIADADKATPGVTEPQKKRPY